MNQTDASFVVNGTKKGAFPARVETRKFGKKVTVLDNCAGDLDALVSHVKKKLGCGGHVSSRNTVELATSDVARLHRTLSAAKALRGVTGEGTSAAKRKEKADAARTVDAEGQTRRETPRVKPRHDATRRAATASRGGATVVVAGEPKTSASSFAGYKSLMQTWPYWEGHAVELPDMFARRKREHEAEIAGAMFEKDSGVEESVERRATARGADSSPDVSAESALRALGMIAEPSAFRQSRFERQREAAAAKKAAKAQSSTQPNWSSTSTTAPRLGASTDPFADYLRDEGGFAPAMSARKHTNVASTSLASRPSSSRVATSRTSRGPARLTKAARPTGGSYASARKATTRFDVERDDSPGTSSSDDDDAPAWRRAGFDVGFTTDSSGKFSFGDARAHVPPPPNRNVDGAAARPVPSRRERRAPARIVDSAALWPTPSATLGDVEAREAEELAEAMRLSKLDYEASTASSARSMHVECGDLYAGMTEDEILALVVAASRAEMDDDASPEDVASVDASSSTRRDDSVPTKSQWVRERLGELFFPDVDVAKTVADVFFASSEHDRDFTLDLLVGAGAPRADADAFCDLYASLTLED